MDRLDPAAREIALPGNFDLVVQLLFQDYTQVQDGIGVQYVIVYMDILGMDVRFRQLIRLIHVIVTLFAMAMVLVPTEEPYVIVYMDILGMDVRFHQLHISPIHLNQQKTQTMTLIQIKLIVLMYQPTPTQSG